MLTLLITLLIFALVAAVLCYVARRLLTAFAVPEPWSTVVYCLVILILLVIFLNEMGWVGSAHAWRHF